MPTARQALRGGDTDQPTGQGPGCGALLGVVGLMLGITVAAFAFLWAAVKVVRMAWEG